MTSDRETCALCVVRRVCRRTPTAGAKFEVLPVIAQFLEDNRDSMLCLRDQAVKFSISDLNDMGAMKGQGDDDDIE